MKQYLFRRKSCKRILKRNNDTLIYIYATNRKAAENKLKYLTNKECAFVREQKARYW